MFNIYSVDESDLQRDEVAIIKVFVKYFLLPSPSHGVLSFLGFENLSLSIPLCEWLTSTPFLLLVYYIYIYIYIYSEKILKSEKGKHSM